MTALQTKKASSSQKLSQTPKGFIEDGIWIDFPNPAKKQRVFIAGKSRCSCRGKIIFPNTFLFSVCDRCGKVYNFVHF